MVKLDTFFQPSSKIIRQSDDRSVEIPRKHAENARIERLGGEQEKNERRIIEIKREEKGKWK